MTEPKKRAPRGTGSVITRSGKVWGQYSAPDPATGNRKQFRIGPFRTETEARKALTKQLNAINGGTFIAPPKPKLLGEILDAWLAVKLRLVRPTTYAQYRDVIGLWLRPHLGGVKVAALTKSRIEDVLADLGDHGGVNGKPLSTRSVQLAAVVLRMAIEWAVEEGWAVQNPARGVKVRQQRATAVWWTADEARQFLAAVKSDDNYALWVLLLSRGLRRGEALGLAWSSLDLDGARPALTVSATRVLVSGKPTASEPKTAAGRRQIPLDAQLVEVLRQHRRQQLQHRLAAGTAWAGGDYVFADSLGQPLRPDSVSHAFARLCDQAKVPRIRLHATRHSAASAWLAQGVNVKVVSELLGHADTRITTEIYQHTVPSMGEAAGQALTASLLGG